MRMTMLRSEFSVQNGKMREGEVVDLDEETALRFEALGIAKKATKEDTSKADREAKAAEESAEEERKRAEADARASAEIGYGSDPLMGEVQTHPEDAPDFPSGSGNPVLAGQGTVPRHATRTGRRQLKEATPKRTERKDD